MKYVFLQLRDRHGEYEWCTDGVYELQDDVNIEEWAEEMAKNQWSEDEYDEEKDEWTKKLSEQWPGFNDHVYFSPSGDVATKVHSVREIKKEHYEVLKQYL